MHQNGKNEIPVLKELFMDRHTDDSLLKMFNKVASNMISPQNNLVMYAKNGVKQYPVAKGGIRINGVKFINKTHNTPSVTDTNQDMANYSLKLVKRKKKKYQQGAKVDFNQEVGTVALPEVVVIGHKPSAFDKILGWLKNATLGAAIAENPAVATASGWSIDSKTGKVSQHPPTEAERQLGNNLFTIGEVAITAPTLVSDIGVIASAVRHPIRTTKTVGNIVKDVKWFKQHPGYNKVYHVNKKGETFSLQDARTASPSNIGIHVTPHKHISKTFNQNAPVMEAYIPRADMETIDIGANDYRLLSNDYIVDSRPFPWSYYDGSGNPQLYLNLLRKYGADPTKVGNKIYTKIEQLYLLEMKHGQICHSKQGSK